MNFLLKIVEGPNAGAEIALAEGMTVSLGRGDACDIILSDASLPDLACELEVTRERVMMLFPDGQQQRMEDYHVVMLGTTALALGPAEGAWQPLIHDLPAPAAETAADGATSAPTETAGAAQPAPPAPAAPAEAKDAPKSSRRRILTAAAAAVLLLAVGAGIFLWTAASAGDGTETDAPASGFVGMLRAVLPEAPLPPPPPPTLEKLAKTYRLTAENKAGCTELRGDFGSRAERLKATARIFHAHPGTRVNFTDAESLRTAVENMLALVSDGDLTVREVKGRCVRFAGRVASAAELKRILRAVAADVPKIEQMTCEEVRVGGTVQLSEATDGDAASQSAAAAAAEAPVLDEARRLAAAREEKDGDSPEMPVVGLLTHPYPCLVLRDGSRAMEGARFGDYTILSILPDRVTLNGPEGTFVWRP